MAERKRPHIIIINPDEMRWDTMGHMGNRQPTRPFWILWQCMRRCHSTTPTVRIRCVFPADAVFLPGFIPIPEGIAP